MGHHRIAGNVTAVCFISILFVLLVASVDTSTASNSTSIPHHCRKTATCVPVEDNLSCGSTSIDHPFTTFVLVQESENWTTSDVLHKLRQWSGLRQVPTCWEKILPLLCALYTPNCVNGSVELPGRDMCEETRGPCEIVEIRQGWPAFLNCSNDDIYGNGCSDHVEDRKKSYWEKAAHSIRVAGGASERSASELKKKWSDLKILAKKYQRAKHATGGGPAADYSPVYEAVLEAMAPQARDGVNALGTSETDPLTAMSESSQNTFQEVTLNSTGECEYPLVTTDNEASWYEHVEGCGVQCQNVYFSEGEHSKMHTFVAVLASLCLVLTFFTLATFIADWKNSSRYPAVILFYINGCFFMASVGFLAQFPQNARQDIVCRSDNTMRIGEPSEGENLSCLIVFIIVYYFIMAGVSWFVILSFAWHVSFRALGTPVDALQGKTGYFHIISWVFPFIMVVIILACNQVDGSSLMGICFVGEVNHVYRTIFVLFPTAVAVIVSAFYLTNGVFTLCHVDRDNPGLLSNKAAARIKGTIARIGVFASLNFMYVLITLACHLYVFTNEHRWREGIEDYLYCRAEVKIDLDGDVDEEEIEETCTLSPKPNLAVMMIHIFSFFCAGITMSTWVWTPSSLAIWKRAWLKITRQPINEPQKLRKSRMIAKAFARKKNQKEGGEEEEEDNVSLSFESASHDDAIGMKFDIPVSSVANSSSTWGGNVPTRMLNRRGAAMPIAAISNSSSPAPQTPDSAVEVGSMPRSRNLIRTQAVIEPLPEDLLRKLSKPKKKHRRRKRATVIMQGPSRMETPMPDDFAEDEDNCITLADGATLAGSSGIGTLNESRLGSGPSEESVSRRLRLERLDRARSAMGSRVPKLPAIESKKVVHPVHFEIPGVSYDDVL